MFDPAEFIRKLRAGAIYDGGAEWRGLRDLAPVTVPASKLREAFTLGGYIIPHKYVALPDDALITLTEKDFR